MGRPKDGRRLSGRVRRQAASIVRNAAGSLAGSGGSRTTAWRPRSNDDKEKRARFVGRARPPHDRIPDLGRSQNCPPISRPQRPAWPPWSAELHDDLRDGLATIVKPAARLGAARVRVRWPLRRRAPPGVDASLPHSDASPTPTTSCDPCCRQGPRCSKAQALGRQRCSACASSTSGCVRRREGAAPGGSARLHSQRAWGDAAVWQDDVSVNEDLHGHFRP